MIENPMKGNDRLLIEYFETFKKCNKAIEVNFRELFPLLNNPDRYTHLIHPYPAKLLVHIPYFFLNNSILSKEGDYVLDPFCGTGTVLLEALHAKKNAVGADSNPLARLIARTKTSNFVDVDLTSHLEKILARARKLRSPVVPDVVNIKYWFPESAINNLGRILRSINEVQDEHVKDFFLICFSNCVKKSSYADPRVSVPVKLNPNRFEKNDFFYKVVSERLEKINTQNVFEKFRALAQENIKRFQKSSSFASTYTVNLNSTDARELMDSDGSKLKENSIDLIITSPPYAGAQKYIRSSSLNLGWLQLANTKDLTLLNQRNIGREILKSIDYKKTCETGIKEADHVLKKINRVNSTRYMIASTYLIEMMTALKESIRVLKEKGFLVLVIGNNKTCDFEFNTQQYLTSFLLDQGLKCRLKLIDDIKSYGLMTKRNKTADIISREWILVFEK